MAHMIQTVYQLDLNGNNTSDPAYRLVLRYQDPMLAHLGMEVSFKNI